jgi:ABC-type antimicrobial peptide transport system permease subunit
METRVADSVASRTFQLRLVLAFGGAAVLLVMVGIYGVVSHAVGLRSREIAIRIAVGATPGAVRRLVGLQVIPPLAIGMPAGVPAAVTAALSLQSLLFEVVPYDVTTVAGVVALLAIVSALAAWVPARRACAIQPASTLGAH